MKTEDAGEESSDPRLAFGGGGVGSDNSSVDPQQQQAQAMAAMNAMASMMQQQGMVPPQMPGMDPQGSMDPSEARRIEQESRGVHTGNIYIPPKDEGKMFVGGLNWETTDESLKSYFSQFGEVLECNVMRDNVTGRSRGFGFLSFAEARTVNRVMEKREHFLDGKIIDPKRAIPREEQDKTAKIFVGGVGSDVTENDFKEFFDQFGTVIDAQLMIDKDTGRPRGFGFVTFDSDQAVERIVTSKFLILKNKPIEVKRAEPRTKGELAKMEVESQVRNVPSSQYGMGMGMYGMNPQMMSQYYQRWQAYMAQMQQMMMAQGQQMNPAMMQQMAQMNPAMMQQMGMNPAMMGQMQMNPAMMGQYSPQMQQAEGHLGYEGQQEEGDHQQQLVQGSGGPLPPPPPPPEGEEGGEESITSSHNLATSDSNNNTSTYEGEEQRDRYHNNHYGNRDRTNHRRNRNRSPRDFNNRRRGGGAGAGAGAGDSNDDDNTSSGEGRSYRRSNSPPVNAPTGPRSGRSHRNRGGNRGGGRGVYGRGGGGYHPYHRN